MYGKSAQIYDRLYLEKFDYPASAQQLHSLVQSRDPSATTWLDVACGTGLHLSYLQEHYEVAGIDTSAEMLRVASERLAGRSLQQADMRAFDLGTRFDVVSCLFSSIGYMRNSQELESAVASMTRHLNPRGLLLVEPWLMPDKWTDGHLGADFVEHPDLKLARMSHQRREGRTTSFDMHHLVLTAEGPAYFVEDHTLFMFNDQEYREAFERSGLTVDLIEGGLAGRGLYVGVA